MQCCQDRRLMIARLAALFNRSLPRDGARRARIDAPRADCVRLSSRELVDLVVALFPNAHCF